METVIEAGTVGNKKWKATNGVDIAYGRSPNAAVKNLEPLLQARLANEAELAERARLKREAELAAAAQQREDNMAANRKAVMALFKVFNSTATALDDLGYFKELNDAGLVFLLRHGRHPKDAYSDWSEFKGGR